RAFGIPEEIDLVAGFGKMNGEGNISPAGEVENVLQVFGGQGVGGMRRNPRFHHPDSALVEDAADLPQMFPIADRFASKSLQKETAPQGRIGISSTYGKEGQNVADGTRSGLEGETDSLFQRGAVRPEIEAAFHPDDPQHPV